MSEYKKIKDRLEELLGKITIEERKLSFDANGIKHAFVRVEGGLTRLVVCDAALDDKDAAVFSRWVAKALKSARAIREKISKLEEERELLKRKLKFIRNFRIIAQMQEKDNSITVIQEVPLVVLKDIVTWAEDLLK